MKQHQGQIRAARLLCSSAGDVYADLKASADLPERDRFWQSNELLEAELLARNDRLIDLALAGFGTEKKTVSELYRRSVGGTDTITVGIRLACLSNQVVDGFWSMFPATIMSEEDIKAILYSDEEMDAAALLANPKLEARFLANLFARKGVFADLPDVRWLKLITLAADNKRISTCRDTSDGPDMGHYDIHKSILSLAENAPTTKDSIHVIYNLLSNLNPSHTHGDGNLQSTISRWSAIKTTNYKGEPEDGYYTGLSFTDEFLCLVGALYGKTYADGKSTVAGSLNAEEPALRASYYGNTKLSEKEMKAAYEKDKAMFVFSSLWNDSLFYDRKLRGIFEEQYLTGDFAALYRRRLLELKDRWPNMDVEPVVDWVKEDAPANEQPMLSAPVPDYSSELAEIKRRFGSLEKNLFWGFIILCAILYFSKH